MRFRTLENKDRIVTKINDHSSKFAKEINPKHTLKKSRTLYLSMLACWL